MKQLKCSRCNTRIVGKVCYYETRILCSKCFNKMVGKYTYTIPKWLAIKPIKNIR